MLKLLKASRTPNPAACVEDIRYPRRAHPSPRRCRETFAACKWIEQTTNPHLRFIKRGQVVSAQALVNAACLRDYTAAYYRLDDLANQLAVYQHHDPARSCSLKHPLV